MIAKAALFLSSGCHLFFMLWFSKIKGLTAGDSGFTEEYEEDKLIFILMAEHMLQGVGMPAAPGHIAQKMASLAPLMFP